MPTCSSEAAAMLPARLRIALRSHDGLLELDELAARKDQGLNDQRLA